MRSKTLIEKILHNPVVQALVVFVSGGWIVLEITEYLITNFHLNAKARNILLVVLLCLLPIVIFLAWYLPRKHRLEKEREVSGGSETEPGESVPKKSVTGSNEKLPGGFKGALQWIRTTKIWIPVLVIGVAIGLSSFFRQKEQDRVRWAREVALPELREIAAIATEGHESWKGLDMAMEVAEIIPEEFQGTNLWQNLAWNVDFYSEPSGAEVFVRPYPDTTESWRYLGTTPLKEALLPRGLFRLKLTKEGFRTTEDLIWRHWYFISDDSLYYPLIREGTIPDEMESVPYKVMASRLNLPGRSLSTSGLQHLDRPPMEDFLIDRFEVTNREYKRIVDAGGYVDPAYWEHPFVKDGIQVGWEEAMALFTDQTGRPGPSTWQVGDFPEGEENYPVGGSAGMKRPPMQNIQAKIFPRSIIGIL